MTENIKEKDLKIESSLKGTSKDIKTPADLLKIDFENYLNNQQLQEKITKRTEMGNDYEEKIPSNVILPEIRQQICEINYNTYFVNVYYKKKVGEILKITKLIDSILYKVKPYYLVHNNKTLIPLKANMQLIFQSKNGEVSNPVLLDNKSKSNFKNFVCALNETNNKILTNFNDQSFLIFMNFLKKKEHIDVFSLVNPGKVNYKNFTGRMYQNAYMNNGEVISANEHGEVKFENTYLALDHSKLAILPKLYLGEYNINQELSQLLKQTEAIYKKRYEPFLCFGAAALVIYIEEIWDNSPGFPIIYLQGNTKQGKSLLQGVVSNMYGYSKKSMAMGNSTDNAIALKCHYINSTPVCINDYDFIQAQSAKFENNVVHLYETGIREKLNNGSDFNLQPISSTAIYSSNYLPVVKEKIFNRLLPLYFPDNGIDTKQITKDYVEDMKRSRILAEVQRIGWEKVSQMIEDAETYILSLCIFENKDRESHNVAVAYAGLKILCELANYKFPDEENKLKDYCFWYNDMLKKRSSPVDNFLNLLPSLYHNKSLKKNTHYKIRLDEGRVIFTFDTQECVALYNAYCNEKNLYDLIINPKTIGIDFGASEYFIGRGNQSYSNGKQASSTTLDITDSTNGKCFYYLASGVTYAEFAEKLKEK